MEIERKFTVKKMPEHLETYPRKEIEQAYLCQSPVIRVRRSDERFELTCKGEGLLAHEELNLPLDEAAYRKLLAKAEGRVIRKTRYLLPCPPYTIELDVFHGDYDGLVIAEVEFPSIEEAGSFECPGFFDRDVTNDPAYYNANMAFRGL